MSTRREFEIGVVLGRTYWKVLKFIVNRISRDAYLILPIPYAGLHWSIHPPKPPSFSDWLIHVRSREFGIEEKVDLDVSSTLESLGSFVEGFVDSCRVCTPTNEEILVMPPNLFSCFAEHQMGNKKKAVVDIGQLIRATATGTFYRTKVKHLPYLLRKVKGQNPSFSRDVTVFGVSDDKMVIPITTRQMLELDYRQLTEKLSRMPAISAFFDPMQRAIERLKAERPDLFRDWFPNDLKRDFSSFMEPLKSSKPRVVDFP